MVELIAPTTCFLSKYIQLNSQVPYQNQPNNSSSEWIVSNEQAFETIPEDIETLSIRQSACLQRTKFSIALFQHLHTLILCNETLPFCTSFSIDELPALQHVELGQYCCTNQHVGSNPKIEGCCRIANCPALHSIEFGSFACQTYFHLEFHQLPSLKQLNIGTNCFQFIPRVVFRGRLSKYRMYME